MSRVTTPPTVVPKAAAIRGYGSSLMIAQLHTNVVSDRYLTKLAQLLGANVERNYGVNGSKLIDPGTPLQAWTHIWSHQADRLPHGAASPILDQRPPQEALAVLDHGVNDGGSFGATANFQTAFATTLEAAVRMLRAGWSWRNTDAAITYGGGWTSQPTAPGFGGTRHTHATGSNGVVTFTTQAGFLGGPSTFYATARPDANETWTCNVSVDGGASIKTVVSDALGIAGRRIPVPITFTAPAGAHTVTLTFSSIGAGGMSFLGGTLESQWPPVVAILGQPTLPVMPPASETNLTQGVLDGLNATMAATPALFTDGKVRYVDLSVMNTAAHWYEDSLHFSPDGHSEIADLIYQALQSTGGIPGGYSAGPIGDWAGIPDWSGAPGTQYVLDTTTNSRRVWTPNSILAGDWVPAVTDREQRRRAAFGVAGETSRLEVCTTASVPTSQSIWCRLQGFEAGDVITNLCACVSVAGAGTVPTLIKLALVDTTGAVLATTANLASDAGWTTLGPKAFALSAQYTVATSGGYYIAFLMNGSFVSTNLQLVKTNMVAGVDLGLGAGPRGAALGGTGQTDITGTLTLANGGASAGFWFAWN